MHLAGISVRRVDDITEALWGTKVSPGTIGNLNKKACKHIEIWRSRPLATEYPYVCVDGVYLKRSWGGEIQNVSILVTIGVNQDGYPRNHWCGRRNERGQRQLEKFLRLAKRTRSKRCPSYFGDKCLGMLESIP